MTSRTIPPGGAGNEEPDRWNLDDWAAYKKQKAHAFVERGYSVEWSPDVYAWMSVYLPERHERNRPQVLAEAKFFMEPSHYGIDGGKISKLSITTCRTNLMAKVLGRDSETMHVIYNYDRGLDVDRLSTSREAKRLYNAVLEELN